MIIDVRTHVWFGLDQLGREVAERLRSEQLKHWGHLDGSPAAHEREMTCVDGALILGFRSDLLESGIPNEYVAEFVAKDPRRRVGIAGIDPMSPDALDQLETAVGLGMSGVCVSPVCQGFHPAHSGAMRIYERCHALSMPLFVSHPVPLTARAQLEFARPAMWDEVARLFPGLPIVISQLGHPWVDETLLLLGKHDNVWADISGVATRPWQLYNALLNALSFGVMDRLLFGSGFPHELPAKTIESLYSINALSHGTQFPAIPRSQIRGIVERDAIACLGLEALLAPRSGETRSTPGDRRPAALAEPPLVEAIGAPDGPAGRRDPVSGPEPEVGLPADG